MAWRGIGLFSLLLLLAGASLLWLRRGSAILLDLSFVGCF